MSPELLILGVGVLVTAVRVGHAAVQGFLDGTRLEQAPLDQPRRLAWRAGRALRNRRDQMVRDALDATRQEPRP